jgi:hypothetical protein
MIKRIRKLLAYSPIKPNGWLLIAFIAVAIYGYNQFSTLPGDQAKVQIILSILVLIICGIVISFSLISTLMPYLLFWIKKFVLANQDTERDIIELKVLQSQRFNGDALVKASVYGIRKPLLGWIRLSVFYDDNQSAEVLLNQSFRHNGRPAVSGEKLLLLPHIREYHFHSAIIRFEDFFHIFALPYQEKEHISIFTEPPKNKSDEFEIYTKTSEDPIKKVVHHRTAKGELLDYKKYAPGDDIRRIIWKNYARNRELTVRIHDRTFPYVSHINVLPSFYHHYFSVNSKLLLNDLLLDIYKEKLRQVVDAIIEQGYSVNLITDQPIMLPGYLNDYERMIYRISTMNWQKVLQPINFYLENSSNLRNGSTILICASTSELHTFLQNGAYTLNNLTLMHYNASATFSNSPPPSLLKRLFFIDTLDIMEVAKREQGARKLVQRIQQNDSAIIQINQQLKREIIII